MKLCSFSGATTVLIMSVFPSLYKGNNLSGKFHCCSLCFRNYTRYDTCFIMNFLNSTKQISTIILSHGLRSLDKVQIMVLFLVL